MMPRKDPEARKAYHREYMRRRLAEDPAYREAHMTRIRANDKIGRAETRRLISEFKDAGCAVCDEREKVCLSAHHINMEEKEFNLGDAVRAKFGVKRVTEELAKCVCLCHNCHAKVHAGIIKIDCRGVEKGHLVTLIT